MKALIACEESQVVCKEFRARGHEAYSADIIDCSGGHPEWHIKGDVLERLNDGWDMMIAHPPCTYLSNVGIKHFNEKNYGDKAIKRKKLRDKAFVFFMKLANAPINKICVENPVGWVNSHYRKADQIIHPYYFGDSDLKRTCLWLKGLFPLIHSKGQDLFYKKTFVDKPAPKYICQGKKSKGKKIYFSEGIRGVKDRAKARSKTFPGIARAMATQWF